MGKWVCARSFSGPVFEEAELTVAFDLTNLAVTA